MDQTKIESQEEKPVKVKKSKVPTKVEIGALIRTCSGKRHAWFQSNIGPVRKPIQVGL
jgi:hypothetical protein